MPPCSHCGYIQLGRWRQYLPSSFPFYPGFRLQYSFTLTSGLLSGIRDKNVRDWSQQRSPHPRFSPPVSLPAAGFSSRTQRDYRRWLSIDNRQ